MRAGGGKRRQVSRLVDVCVCVIGQGADLRMFQLAKCRDLYRVPSSRRVQVGDGVAK